MAKSIKLKNNNYWDSSAIKHNRNDLSDYLVGKSFGITKTLQMTEANVWYDTGISGTDLDTRVYIVRAYVDQYSGTNLYWERAVGIMQWYSGGTNNNTVNEIPLHQSGHGNNGGVIHLRTKRNFSGNLSLQMMCERAWTKAVPVYFTFRVIM